MWGHWGFVPNYASGRSGIDPTFADFFSYFHGQKKINIVLSTLKRAPLQSLPDLKMFHWTWGSVTMTRKVVED